MAGENKLIAQRKNLALDKGATFKQSFRYLNAEREPYDLADYKGWFRILKRGELESLIKEVELELDSNGLMTVYIPDEETSLLNVDILAYTLEIEDPSGDIQRLLYGQLQVRAGNRV